MGFLRSKSRGKGDDAEPHRRNRLSKPMTRKSQTNLRTAEKQQVEGEACTADKAHFDSDDIVITPTSTEERAKVRSQLFQLDNEFSVVPTKGTQTVKSGVAQLVAQFETTHPVASVSQISLGSQMKKRPMSAAIISSYELPVTQNVKRGSLMNSPDHTASFRTSNLSQDTLGRTSTSQDPFAIPTRRRSNFRPGEATRKPSKVEHTTRLVGDKASEQDADDDDALSFIEGTEREAPYISVSRPDLGRSDTPGCLERTALGNFSLGSLHIVNGRASPALSEASKHLKVQRTLRNRDVSSDYAESEAWEDDIVASETSSTGRRTPNGNLQREFSYVAGAEKRMTIQTPTANPTSEVLPIPKTPTRTTPDRASILAQEYMAELPASPFAEIQFSSPVDSVKSAGSSGSVLRHATDEIFADEGLGHSPQQSRTASYGSVGSSINSKPSVAESKLSSTDSRFAQDEVFQSALEFQQAPESPQYHRSVVPSKQSDPSDSGYSSNNSITSGPVEDKAKASQLETVQETPKSISKESTPKKLGGFLPMRPALKSRATAPAAPLAPLARPTTSNTEVSTLSTVQSESPSSKQDSSRNRLRKVRPIHKLWASKPQKEIVVQRNVSAETYDVPEVLPTVLANLHLRSQQLPELEHTVSGHTKNASSGSSLDSPQDVRFPTPNPEVEEEEDERVTRKSKPRSKSRVRSKSRRRSFIEFFTGGDKSEKRKSDIYHSEHEVTIDDLGDVVATLGANPYDIATPNHKPRSKSPDYVQSRGITPHRLSYQSNRPKSMMDDKTASELARTRSKSIHERDVENERRASFGDRSGKSGKTRKAVNHYRADSTVEDTPPMPPMPSEAQLRRLSWRHSRQYSSTESPQTPSRHWMAESSPQPESSPAPPLPPPHSPRPSFIDHGDVEFEEQDEEDMSLAPPPPCHSPRPVDVSPESEHVPMTEDPWAAQARAWKARRQSAGEALRAQWERSPQSHHEQDPYQESALYHTHGHDYPTIPRKPVARSDYAHAARFAPPGPQGHEWIDPQNNYSAPGPEESWARGAYHDYGTGYDDADYPHGNEQYHEYQNYQDNAYHQSQYEPRYDDVQQQPQHSRHHPRDTARKPLPTPSRALPLRPTSRHSHLSYHSNHSAVSLADELHPQDRSRQQPAPEFGRYSGGLQYSYEGREKGFAGSAGTRSISGKAEGAWKGTELRQNWGVDLGDVPIMGTAVRAP